MLNAGLSREQLQRRQRHAHDELGRLGVLENGHQWAAVRLIMWLFPRATPPQYGDGLFWTLAISVFFWLFLAFIPVLMFFFDPGNLFWGLPVTVGIALICGSALSKVIRATGERIGVTPWDRLDEPPPEDVSEGAAEYARLATKMYAMGKGMR